MHPKLRERIDYEATAFPDLMHLPVPEGREAVRQMARDTDRLAGVPPAMDSVEDHSVATPTHRLRVRLYRPPRIPLPAPVLAYLHGGGWVFGDLDTHDSLCREIAARAGTVVASIDYSRSPEAKYPVALDDGAAALRWLADPATARRLRTRPDRIAIGGDSAGGNMSAVLSVRSRDEGGPVLSGQLLICPVISYAPETPSYRANAVGFGLDASFMPWMWQQYLSSPREGEDARVAPIRTPDVSRLPPALVITAEYDILRDEGERYAERLRQAGVPTVVSRYDGMVHGFLDYRGFVPEGRAALDEIGRTVRRWFGSD